MQGCTQQQTKKGGGTLNELKLRGRIREKFGTQEAFADAMGMSNTTLSAKLNRKTDWKRQEIETACRLLGIDAECIPVYFFTS